MTKKKHVHTQISPFADNILTSAYLLLIIYSVRTFFFKSDDHSDLYWFIAFCALVWCAISLTEFFAKVLARDLLSKYILNSGPHNDPLSRPKQFYKFTGTLWQLVIHFSATLFELYILWDETWLSQPHTCNIPFEYTPKQTLRLFYILQIAIWIMTCWSHRFNSDAHAHKDYLIMYIHHIATIALVSISYSWDQTRIGLVVLFIHDASDIGIDLLKLNNYLTLESFQHFFCVEVAFFMTLVMWAYYRLYYYPAYIISYGVLWAGGIFHDLGFPFPSPHGDTPIIQTIDPLIQSNYYILCLICAFLLILLFAMHIWWFLLLLRILSRLLRTTDKDAHDTGRKEYEGDSDDEGDNEGEDKKQEIADKTHTVTTNTNSASESVVKRPTKSRKQE